MRCSSCGSENREGRKFRAGCGAALTLACAACGASNQPGERFCGEFRARDETNFWIAYPGLALALFHCGEPARALAIAREDVAFAAHTGTQVAEIELQIELAEVAARCGHEAEARTALARARELAEQTECRLLVPSIHEAAAVLAETLGNTEQRLMELRAAHRLFVEMGATGHAERIAPLLAESAR
jgi:Double zinc ribbon